MKTTIQETEKEIVAVLAGELDTAAAPEFETAMQPLFESKGRDIVIDCTDLEYIASSGLRILLNILKKAKAAGSKVVLRNVNDIIRDVLDMTGFVNLFEFA